MPYYFDFRVSLTEIKPEIWRRFLLDEDDTFEDLHYAIQHAFGWDNEHLFEFRDMDGCTPIACAEVESAVRDDDTTTARELKLDLVFAKPRTKCFYIYDFGDDWWHAVELVGIVELSDKFERRLLDGARACPPEDCGGVGGYEGCVEVVGMSEADIEKSEEMSELKEWVGDWNPEAFDLQAAKQEFDE